MGGPWQRLGLSGIGAVSALVASFAVTSGEMPDQLHLKAAPFLLYAAHPSMPLPPIGSSFFSCNSSVIPCPCTLRKTDLPSSPLPLSSSSLDASPASAWLTMSSIFSSSTAPCAVSSTAVLSTSIPHPSAGTLRSIQDTISATPLTVSSHRPPPLGNVQILSRMHIFPQGICPLNRFKSCKSPFWAPPSCLYIHSQSSQSGTSKQRFGLLGFTPIIRPLSALSVQRGRLHDIYASIARPSPHSYLASFYSSLASSPHARAFQSLMSAHQHSLWSRYFHAWHYPADHNKDERQRPSSGKRPVMAVILLGWLGAKQKHLKRYANWYTARGVHAVTFVIPMWDLLGLKPGGKAEQNIDVLSNHLAVWLNEAAATDGDERVLMFHTFSNTGWLTYGVVLEKLLKHNAKLVDKIKGCVVDSAPMPDPDPHVWASGFSAALLKRRSIAIQGINKESMENLESGGLTTQRIQPDVTETALVIMLEKFFHFFLQLPTVKKRLSEVVAILSKKQPQCPQLYLYSSADSVIPAESVELFIEQQKQAGKMVRACNLQWSPHVDHFRSFPDVYSSQLVSFLEECHLKRGGS